MIVIRRIIIWEEISVNVTPRIAAAFSEQRSKEILQAMTGDRALVFMGFKVESKRFRTKCLDMEMQKVRIYYIQPPKSRICI